ncbi:MAG: type II toxin-antitoxin system VapB family antitoxin [Terrimicrobiaceae bacterium]
MRISVDIAEDVLEEVMALTGEKSKSPALAKAVTEFVRRQRAKEFGRLIREGAFDYPDPVGGDIDFANPVPALIKD